MKTLQLINGVHCSDLLPPTLLQVCFPNRGSMFGPRGWALMLLRIITSIEPSRIVRHLPFIFGPGRPSMNNSHAILVPDVLEAVLPLPPTMTMATHFLPLKFRPAWGCPSLWLSVCPSSRFNRYRCVPFYGSSSEDMVSSGTSRPPVASSSLPNSPWFVKRAARVKAAPGWPLPLTQLLCITPLEFGGSLQFSQCIRNYLLEH